MLVRDKTNNSLIDSKTVIDDTERYNLTGATIPAFRAVNFYLHSSGRFAMRLADTSASGFYVDGFTTVDILDGKQGTVRVLGPLPGFPVLFGSGDDYYSDNTKPGRITSTAPGTGTVQVVGKRWNSTTLYVNPQRGGGGGSGGVSTASLPLSISAGNISLAVTQANNGGAVALQGVSPTAQSGGIDLAHSGQHTIIATNANYRGLSTSNSSAIHPTIYASNSGTENVIEAAAVDGFALKASVNPSTVNSGHMLLVPYSNTLPASPVNGTVYSDANGGIWVRSNGAWTQVVPRGTSFPGSPATGQQFYRTDRKLNYEYDGTRWLTTNYYPAPVLYQPGVARPYLAASGRGVVFLLTAYHPSYDIYLETLTIPTYTQTTHNVSNNWNWDIKNDAGGGVVATLSSWLTGRVANVTYDLTATINTAYTGGVKYYIEAYPTGTPGGLFTYPVEAYYRLIG